MFGPVFSALGLDSFFASIKFAGKMEGDLAGIVRLLVCGRIRQIATPELKMPVREVIGMCHGITQTEDQFWEMKGTLEARLVFVLTKAHIRAHIRGCIIALTMMPLIQRKVRSGMRRFAKRTTATCIDLKPKMYTKGELVGLKSYSG